MPWIDMSWNCLLIVLDQHVLEPLVVRLVGRGSRGSMSVVGWHQVPCLAGLLRGFLAQAGIGGGAALWRSAVWPAGDDPREVLPVRGGPRAAWLLARALVRPPCARASQVRLPCSLHCRLFTLV